MILEDHETYAGESIGSVAEKMVRLSAQSDLTVRTWFNGVGLIAFPYTPVAEIVGKYEEFVKYVTYHPGPANEA